MRRKGSRPSLALAHIFSPELAQGSRSLECAEEANLRVCQGQREQGNKPVSTMDRANSTFKGCS